MSSEQEALIHSEKRYRSLVLVSSQIVWTTDANGQVVEDMPTWRAYTGQTFAEVAGSRWLEALHPDDMQRTWEVWTHAVQTKTFYEIEYRIRSKTGEYRYFLIRGVPILDEDDRIVEWIGTCADIHDRKIAEFQLQNTLLASQKKSVKIDVFISSAIGTTFDMTAITLDKILKKKSLRSVIESTIAAMETEATIANPQGKIVFEVGCGGGAHHHPIIVGGQTIGSVTGNDKVEAIAALLSSMAESELEKKALAKDLLDKYRELSLLDALSTQVAASLDVGEITRLVLAEAATALQSSGGAIVLKNSDENSNEFAILATWGCEDVVETGRELVDRVIANQRSEMVNEAHSDRARSAAPLTARDRILGAIVLLSDRPYRSEDLKLLGTFAAQAAIAIDKALLYDRACQAATEARDRAEQLQQALSELQQTQTQLVHSEKMSSLGQLMAGVAHEINNPVNFIYGNLIHARTYVEELLELIQFYQQGDLENASQLADDIDIDFLQDDLPNLLNSMKMGADRIREIVASLRHFSRSDEAQKQAVNLHDGIDSTLLILNNRLKSKGAKPEIVVVKRYGCIPSVSCLSGPLNQVFMNLFVNAIDAIEDAGTIEPTIEIETTLVEGERVGIFIRDNGPGIPEAIQRQLFDPFFTTKPIGKGTGLGLSISYQVVVEQHGGQIECRSQLGQGTEFYIELPIEDQRSLPTTISPKTDWQLSLAS